MLALAAFAVALWFFPVDCDGAFGVHDGVAYGIAADRMERGSISPHHPLFHAVALALVPPLRALDVPHPGHVAIRILAGLGAAWLLLQICWLAGRERVLVGAAFALPLLASSGFLVETAAGETMLPGAAAALFAVTTAARPTARLASSAAALTLALLLRQDNLFVVPGVALALAAVRPRGARVDAVVKVIGAAGVATLAGYVVAWLVAIGGGMPFPLWLVFLARLQPFSFHEFGWVSLRTYLASFELALVAPFGVASHLALTGACLVLFLAAGLGLRGTAPARASIGGIVLTMIAWALFNIWWLPENFEYVIPVLAFLAAAMAALARGAPATALPSRRAAVIAILGLTVWMVAVHAKDTLRLRERRLADAVDAAIAIGGDDARYLSVGNRASVGLALRGIKPTPILSETGLDNILATIDAEVRSSPGRAIVINDRFALDPTPRGGTRDPRVYVPLDFMSDMPGVRLLRRDGLVYGAVYAAAGDTRSESR